MCFSPEMSFASSIFLFGIGYFSIKNLKSKTLLPIAAIPLMFAMQQSLEGIVWLSKTTNYIPSWLSIIATYGYMFYAFIVWPFWMPFACWYAEPKTNIAHRKALFTTLILGTVVSLILLSQIFLGVQTTVKCYHLIYAVQTNYSWVNPTLTLYAAAVIIPLAISSIPYLWVFGLLAGLTLLFTILFFWYFLISIWCFFAAIVSGLIYLVVKK